MKHLAWIIGATCVLAAFSTATVAKDGPDAAETTRPDALFSTVSRLDARLFDTFNHCASAAQLKKHAGFFAPDLEFYHDQGGVTWSRRDYMQNTREHVCGQFRRKLIPGSLQVFPIKGFGAMEQGRQEFCWIKTGTCFGQAQFLILWRHQDSHWIVTRVFSYGHRQWHAAEGTAIKRSQR